MDEMKIRGFAIFKTSLLHVPGQWNIMTKRHMDQFTKRQFCRVPEASPSVGCIFVKSKNMRKGGVRDVGRNEAIVLDGETGEGINIY